MPYNEEATVIGLPHPEGFEVDMIDLRYALEKRRSRRNYSEKPLTLNEFSWLLWCTQGVRRVTHGRRPRTFRPVPSSGACHPFETYLLVNRVEGVRPGLYRFLAIEHKLVEVNLEEGIADRINGLFWPQVYKGFIEKSAVLFIWTFVPYRMCWCYGHRGPRALMEIGHVAQNLYLSAEAIRCGVCAVDPFNDTKINDTLGIDLEDQFVIYCATVGKRKESHAPK